jgi:hypothetical protein
VGPTSTEDRPYLKIQKRSRSCAPFFDRDRRGGERSWPCWGLCLRPIAGWGGLGSRPTRRRRIGVLSWAQGIARLLRASVRRHRRAPGCLWPYVAWIGFRVFAPCSLLNDFHPGLENAYVPGGQGGSQEAIVEGPMSSDEDHLKMAFSSFARRTEALAICFLRIGSARTR